MSPQVPGYRVGRLIEAGGRTHVYRGTEAASGAPVALRILSPEAATRPEAVRRFQTDAALGQQVDHPAVVRCLQLTQTADGRACAVMERVAGVTLAQLLEALAERGRRLPQDLALQLADAILSALDYIHTRRRATGEPLEIVHRDVQPTKVMVSFAGELKLLDFASARAKLGQPATAPGLLFGTPRYMSPEQLLGEQALDHRCDLYSLGAVLFELLSGEPLLPDVPPTRLLQVLLNHEPPPLEPRYPELRGIDAVLARALAKRPEARYPHAEAFRQALAALPSSGPGVGCADWAALVLDLFPQTSASERSIADRSAERRPPTPPPQNQAAPTPPPQTQAAPPRPPQTQAAPPRRPPPKPSKKDKPPAKPPELPGYTMLRPIAEGGMASVWLARREGFNQPLVIKLLLPQYETHKSVEARFLREAKIMTLLQHDNVAQVVDAGRDDKGRFFLAMEFLPGVDFEALIFASIKHREPMPPEVALGIARGALAGLDHAHEQPDPQTGRPAGIVHRDLSGRNVMVSFTGQAKVIDFGLARLRAAGEPQMTRAGAVLGTLRYMSPEQATGDDRLDRRSDIYAIGVLLHEALTARPLVNGRVAEEVTPQILRATPTPPSQLVPQLPEALDEVILRALEKRAEDRFDRAIGFKRAIEAAAPGLCPADPTDRIADYVQRFAPEAYADSLAEAEAYTRVDPPEDSTTPIVTAPEAAILPVTRPSNPAGQLRWHWWMLGLSLLALVGALLLRLATPSTLDPPADPKVVAAPKK